jgi:hypothetical protein
MMKLGFPLANYIMTSFLTPRGMGIVKDVLMVVEIWILFVGKAKF